MGIAYWQAQPDKGNLFAVYCQRDIKFTIANGEVDSKYLLPRILLQMSEKKII